MPSCLVVLVYMNINPPLGQNHYRTKKTIHIFFAPKMVWYVTKLTEMIIHSYPPTIALSLTPVYLFTPSPEAIRLTVRENLVSLSDRLEPAISLVLIVGVLVRVPFQGQLPVSREEKTGRVTKPSQPWPWTSKAIYIQSGFTQFYLKENQAFQRHKKSFSRTLTNTFTLRKW